LQEFLQLKETIVEKEEMLNRIAAEGLIPLIRAASASDAVQAALAIKEGGAGFIEVTMTVPGAIDVIRELDRQCGDEVIIGAGTILDVEAGRAALLAGARFLVTPGLCLPLVELARHYSAPVILGAMTPTEILAAWTAGADLVKVFPVAQLGGPAYIKAIRGPLPHIPTVPSGGVNLQNAAAFIEAGAAAVGAGGELVDGKAIREKRFEVITENTRKFMAAVRQAREKR
jgi:2-dehydro-3-deoxyphosphogluconate aldolase/(4S)-4-hydroxy-2-oxoglutarate aldolase